MTILKGPCSLTHTRHPATLPPAALSFTVAGKCRADIVLKGHQTEGYGLAWSPFHAGHLLSGSDDAQICVWDISGNPLSGKVGACERGLH
jgi:WD40 repeat protein